MSKAELARVIGRNDADIRIVAAARRRTDERRRTWREGDVSARGEEEFWDVVYYRQADGRTPAIDFLDGCPIKLQARFDAVLDDGAAAPPLRLR